MMRSGKIASDRKKRSYVQTFIRYYQACDGKLLSYFNSRKRHGTALERPSLFVGKRHGELRKMSSFFEKIVSSASFPGETMSEKSTFDFSDLANYSNSDLVRE